MTDITAELAALPKWPEQPSDSFPVIAMNQLVEELTALRARLALAERALQNAVDGWTNDARAYLQFRAKEQP